MIKDPRIEAVNIEKSNSVSEFIDVVNWVYPNFVKIRPGETHKFQTHQRDLGYSRKIANDEVRKISKDLKSRLLDNHTQLNLRMALKKILDSLNCVKKCAASSDGSVVIVSD